jgi:hypothetical protein
MEQRGVIGVDARVQLLYERRRCAERSEMYIEIPSSQKLFSHCEGHIALTQFTVR